MEIFEDRVENGGGSYYSHTSKLGNDKIMFILLKIIIIVILFIVIITNIFCYLQIHHRIYIQKITA